MRLLSQMVAIALAAFPPFSGGSAVAQVAVVSEEGFYSYLPQLRAQAQAAGVSQRTLDDLFPTLQLSRRAIELDRAQPGGTAGNPAVPPFAPYLAQHVSPALISRGRARYSENISRLNEIGRRYGVEPSVLVAIWGKETSYGAGMGDFDLLNALASLAYEGRRRQLFADEFIATLKMYERGFPRSQLKGSWAGAFGHPQFLPSVYLRLGVDGDGDGRSDIWRSHIDALASIANYLSNAGWKPNLSWGYAASVPAGFDRSGMTTRLVSPRCSRVHERHSRWLTIGEWRRLGVVPLGRSPGENELASLLEPDGPGRTAYLLTTNYRAILDYNCSNFYALSVGLLADSISR
jgi:lytic murein transglycosylase